MSVRSVPLCVPLCRKAISLLEVILAVVILSIGVVMILKSFFSGTKAIEYAKNRLAAARFLDQKIAQLRLAALTGENITDGQIQGAEVLNNRNFYWQIDVAALAEEGNQTDSLRSVNATAEWKEANVKKNQEISGYIGL